MKQIKKQTKLKPSIKRNLDLVLPQSKFELSQNQTKVLRNIGEVTLAVAAVAGLATITLVAPNVLQLLNKLPWVAKTYKSLLSKKTEQKNKIVRSFYYLKRTGLVTLIPKGDSFAVKITQKGRKKIRQMQFAALQISKPIKWDGRWWLVLADVPSLSHRVQGDYFREKIKAMGFYPLQRTAWLYPFDPRDEIDFVSAYFDINNFVTVAEVSWLASQDEVLAKRHCKKFGIL